MKVPFLLSLFLLGALPAICAANESEIRTWTNTDGVKVDGEILELDAENITLKTDKGTFRFPLTTLSEEDQNWATEWAKLKEAEMAEKEKLSKQQVGGGFEDLKLGEWPTMVITEFEADQIEIVKEDKDAGEYIYRSPHFEFRSPERLSISVVREFARIFEATFEFAQAMPIGLNPQPAANGYYITQLYRNQDEYQENGGIPGSAGQFSLSSRGDKGGIVKVPLTSLGVEWTGVRYTVDQNKRSDTLTHEIAHQVTGRWLFLVPPWFSEGLAETISTQPYNDGRFRLTSMDRSIREDCSRYSGSERDFTMENLERLMNLDSRTWIADLGGSTQRLNYPSSNLLFYFFARIDGEGDGAHLVNYMKALSEGMEETKARDEFLLRGQTFEELQERVKDGWRSEGLKLEFRDN